MTVSVENLLYTLAGMAVGFAIGAALSVWWTKNEDGADVIRIRLSSRWQRMFYLVLGVMSVLSVGLVAASNEADEQQTQQLADITRAQQQQVARQTFCNRELIRVIGENASVSAADRANLDQLMADIGELVLNPAPNREDRQTAAQDAFRRYNDQRATNAAARQPYPPPDCGE